MDAHDEHSAVRSVRLSDQVPVDRDRLAAIVDSSSDAILAKDRNGVVTAWNPAAERLYGYTAAEMIGQPITVLIPDDLTGESVHILSEVLAGRSVPAYDTTRVTKSGRRVPVSVAVSPIYDASGVVVGASTIARDISERLEAEAARAFAATLVSQSADAIVAIDTEGRITTWNPAAEQMFGYTSAEVEGQLATNIISADERDSQQTIVTSVLKRGQTHRYEAIRRHRDRRELTVEMSIAPLRTASGSVSGAVVSVRDVTAARAAERAAKDAQRREARLLHELDQTRRLESVGQLAGGIAHDFNNLLAVILNLAIFVAQELPEGTPGRADVDEISLTAQRAATLTRQLLIFSRRDVVTVEVLDLGDVVAGLEHLLRRALGERIRLEASADEGLWPLRMDRGQMEQVLVNLAVNARDAMPDGGRLLIEARNTSVDEAFAQTRVGLEPGNYVTLTVSDSGVGMDAKVLERAFEPFYTTKPEGEGTGLGLATIYEIVTEAKGRVAIYSEVGRGTSVSVHLPATEAVAASIASAPEDSPAARGESVLVVEDAPDVLRITERILSNAGYAVSSAATAERALALLKSDGAVDIVLTDVIMPGLTGTAMVEQIRAEHPQMKVVFMSGYSHKMLTHEVLAHKSSSFIEKPFTAHQLRRAMRELLDRDDGV